MAQDKSAKPAARPAAEKDPPQGTTAKPPAKAAGTAKTGETNTAGTTPTPQPSKFANAEKYTVKPEFWDSIFDLIPPWGDEIAALLLIVFGVVSFLALINATSDATIAAAWSNALTGMFGWGSAVICAGIFALGIIILLPKLGVVIRFPTRRILALEFTFLSVLALLHLAAGDQELRAVARAGRGGGQMGWALTAPLMNWFGAAITIVFYVIILVIAIAVMIGIRREQVERFFQTHIAALQAYGREKRPPLPPKPARTVQSVGTLDEALKTKPEVTEDSSGQLVVGTASAVKAQRARTYSIARVRPNLENIAPSVRASLLAPPSPEPKKSDPESNTGTSKSVSDALNTDAVKSNEPPKVDAAAELTALMNRGKEEKPLDAIGTIKGKRVKGEPVMVERPDGRMKRYYTIDNMKEPKSTAKRDEDIPPLDLLRDVEIQLPDETEINNNVVLIENTLLEFDIDIDVVDVKVGPTVTQYAIQPFKEGQSPEGELSASGRTRVNKIASLSNDLALSLSAKRLRIEAPVPGHTYIGLEVPNKKPSVVALRSVYESKSFQEKKNKKNTPLFVPLGRDVTGTAVGIDIGAMPHLLIAGTTGSGKSVAIAALATALVMDNTPDLVKLIMLDPKMVELSRFNGLPHLLGPVETDAERIIGVLRWCTREMDRRYQVLEESAARNIEGYNTKLTGKKRKEDYMPHIVILVDEIGDLMMSHPEETEKSVVRIAQKARAVGMHMIVATQRPSVDVITGLIKANFPSRMSFAVASGVDSRVILDTVGAETLMGKGDMLFLASDAMAPQRIQGCFVSDDEVRRMIQWWRSWHRTEIEAGRSQAINTGPWERGLTRREFLSETDPMLEEAISLVIAEGEASASLIQRKLGLGYPRAARIMDLMQELGVIGEQKPGGRSREVLIKPGRDPFKDVIEKRMKNKAKPVEKPEKPIDKSGETPSE